MVLYKRATTDQELWEIIDLQSRNLKKNVSKEKQISDGFVTACHTFEELKNINDASNAIIATHNNKVVAYALAMIREKGESMPVFDDLFSEIDKIVFQNKLLISHTYLFVGQLCVDEAFRGQGIVENLYTQFFEAFKNSFDFAITDISSLNTRSLKAHIKSGFQKIHSFYDTFTQGNWDIVLLDMRQKLSDLKKTKK